jgi:hypothetical protein
MEIFAYLQFHTGSTGDSRPLAESKRLANRFNLQSLRENLTRLARKEKAQNPEFSFVTGYHPNIPFPVIMGKISWS